jgi:uncharacterized protein YutE (UPF0331/DUF86 family)
MVDRDKIENLVRHLRQYTAYLTDFIQEDQQAYVRNPRSTGSSRYYLQVSIETCINLANHIIAAERMRAPRDYKDSFQVLNEAGILPDDLTDRMKELSGLRNLLVHLYWEVDDRMIYEGIRSELGDFDEYAGFIMAYVDKQAQQ